MKKILTIIFSLLLFTSCKKETIAQDNFVTDIEKAHQKQDFLKQEIVTFDIESYFGTNPWVIGTISLSTDSSKGKIVMKDSTIIIFNGSDVFYSPNTKDTLGVRFNAFTVPYFFMLPYKLSDTGTKLSDYKNLETTAEDFKTKKLSFEANIGDAPNDWYVLYSDKKTNLIQKTAYIVTANKAKEEAEKNPHAIEYLNYKEVNGIPMATNWLFYEWKQDVGLTKEIGKAIISNIRFEKKSPNFFKPEKDFLKK